MYIELKEKLTNLKIIVKTLLTPKRFVLMIWLSILPVGMALMWKEIVKIWRMKRNRSKQTTLMNWEESKKEKERVEK